MRPALPALPREATRSSHAPGATGAPPGSRASHSTSRLSPMAPAYSGRGAPTPGGTTVTVISWYALPNSRATSRSPAAAIRVSGAISIATARVPSRTSSYRLVTSGGNVIWSKR